MADLPNLDGAREALAARKRGKWDDIALTDALAAVDILTARLAEAEATGRRKGLEEAARVCEERGAPTRDPRMSGIEEGARYCAEDIRDLAAKVAP